MTSRTPTRTIVISAVVAVLVAVAGAVVVVLVTRSASSGMTGMSHGSNDMSMSSPATTTADPHDGMAGMDMSGTEHGSEATLSPPPSMTADPHGEMPGMDMSGEDAHGSEVTPGPAPTTADPHGEMPGMDMPGGDTHGATPDPGHDSMVEEASPDRPIVPVLSTFGGGTSAVLLGAGLLRRKDRIRNQAKQAARAARRSAK